ncbi:AAA family ATPase [bacterium]|nr:AAA family ATPase [bacterium]
MNNDDPLKELERVFSPSAPINIRELFFGRQEQLENVEDTIKERGQHAILYGERGVGKTSLANIIEIIFRNITVAKITCNRTDTYNDIWRKIFKRVSLYQSQEGIGFNAKKKEIKSQLDFFLPKEKEVDINDILLVFNEVNSSLLFIFDEFDSFKNTETLLKFTDTIKALSDNAPNVTLLIVGIAESVNDLMGSHESIERSIKQIKLPRMSKDELIQIIDNGMKRLKMQMEPNVKNKIIELSNSFPHYTHLLSKYSTKRALKKNLRTVDQNCFDEAIEEAVTNAQESVRNAYHQATMTSRGKTKFKDVLSACALVEEDEYGTFRASDIIDPMNKLTGREHILQSFSYHLGTLCQNEKGEILQKIGPQKQCRYRFKNPLLKSFIRLKLHQERKY